MQAGQVNPADDAGTAGEGEGAVFIAALQRLGLLQRGDDVRLTQLTGGVSSDIRLVHTGGRVFCAKRALAQLRVAQRWEAPVARNAAEAAYFRTVAAWLPEFVPALLGEDAEAGLFAMAYLEPARHPLWKTQLLAGQADAAFAAQLGAQLARVHALSARDAAVPARFDNDAQFDALRLAPYLGATAARHPALARRLHALADATRQTHLALVHGDVSPKNILAGPLGPVLLDAECAWFGDPAFDLAFCLKHLLLKGAHRPQDRPAYGAAFLALAEAYLAAVDWEPAATLQARAAALLPALLLARVDGKSPVEYLQDEARRDFVRSFAVPFIAEPPELLKTLLDAWSARPVPEITP